MKQSAACAAPGMRGACRCRRIAGAHILAANADRPVINSVGAIRGFEATAKTLNTPIVLSDDFACLYGEPFISLGHYPLRGLAKPHELFVPAIGSHPPRVSS